MKVIPLTLIFLFIFLPPFADAAIPEITHLNTNEVGLYEKLEIEFILNNAVFNNPYNPDEIDVRAYFTSPSGKVWEIFGFYDNYQSVNKWKIRFSPNETGNWNFYITAQDANGEGQSNDSSFTAVASGHQGWLHVSSDNPHYFEFDNGNPFYGISAYNPWGVTYYELQNLANHGGNLVGYWNINYGGEGTFIESLNSGLGSYDQPKCKRIDQLLEWCEELDLKMMLAIWPHDLLSNTVWAHQWHNNPYKNITTVENFYGSPEAWAYQEKQYRYIIARWGYSRGLGIWEIVNEINGTDGWVAGYRETARQWVRKVHQFLSANDPFNRPTTASMSGGEYWPDGYSEVSIPNIHVYETGWSAKYTNNPLRSSAWLYNDLAKTMYSEFTKPNIYGEAGYTNSYGNFSVPSADYTAMYHNSLWAGWAGGAASTPVWWDYPLMYTDMFDQLNVFKTVIEKIDYNTENTFTFLQATSETCDVFGMENGSTLFGWIRDFYANTVSETPFTISADKDTSYWIQWYNTWTGELIEEGYQISFDKTLHLSVPAISADKPDAAFIIRETAEGSEPYRLNLSTPKYKINTLLDSTVTLKCIVVDDQGRFVRDAENAVTFSLIGEGTLVGANPSVVQNGLTFIAFLHNNDAGVVQVIASAAGLVSDTLDLEISNKLIMEDFESYISDAALEQRWVPWAQHDVSVGIDKQNFEDGRQGMFLEYSIGGTSPTQALITRTIQEDWRGINYLRFWMKGDGSGRNLDFWLKDGKGMTWYYTLSMAAADGEVYQLDFADFLPAIGTPEMDKSNILELKLVITKGSGEDGSGIIYFDNFEQLVQPVLAIEKTSAQFVPDKFRLDQNYPNPFNPETVIKYVLKVKSEVKLEVYDPLGRVVRTLVSENQNAGSYNISFNGTDLASGIYYYRLQAGQDFIQTRKLLLLR